MLRVEPRQRARLIKIAHNLTDRIAEARANGWLGEVQGLQVSLEAARKKLASLDRGCAIALSQGQSRSEFPVSVAPE